MLNGWNASFIVVGTQKGGTTALRSMINAVHPQLCMSQREMHIEWFVRDWTAGSWSTITNETRFARHANQISSCRQRAANRNATPVLWGLSDPILSFLAPLLSHKLASFAPSLKLVFLLREPMQRAYSHYQMTRTNTSFEALVADELHKVAKARAEQGPHLQYSSSKWHVPRGLYAEQLVALLQFFPEDQLHITISECSARDPLGEYNRIFRFLGASSVARLPVLDSVAARSQTRYARPGSLSNGTSSVWGVVRATVVRQLFEFSHSSTAWLYAYLSARVALWDAWYAALEPSLHVRPLDTVSHLPCAFSPISPMYNSCRLPATVLPRRSGVKQKLVALCNTSTPNMDVGRKGAQTRSVGKTAKRPRPRSSEQTRA